MPTQDDVPSDNFQTVTDEDFINQLELTTPLHPLSPIIMVPGVGGSKLLARDRKTGREETAWVKPTLQASSIFSKYCWSRTNPETGETEEIAKRYYEVLPVRGIRGCDHIIDTQLVETPVVANLNIDQYFGKLADLLQRRYGYELSRNLFAFTYLWYHSPAERSIQDELHEMIQRAHYITGRKVIIIAHSLGGVVTETYMRLHPYSDDYIQRFISICTPFDGASGYVLQSPLMGYNLRLPIPNITAKGAQCSSGCLHYLLQKPQGLYGAESQIFVKKIIDEDRKDEEFKQEACATRYESEMYDKITLHPEVYGEEPPDTLFIVAEEIVTQRSVRPELLADTFTTLQRGCRQGAIVLAFPGVPAAKAGGRIDYVLERNYRQRPSPAAPFRWECFAPWHPCADLSGVPERRYGYTTTHYCKMVQGDGNDRQLHFTREFHQLLAARGTLRQSAVPHLRDFVIAKQYYLEQNGRARARGCCVGRHGQEMRGPWCDADARATVPELPLYQLVNQAHGHGTLEQTLFPHLAANYRTAADVRSAPIVLREETDFRFASINGYCTPTPYHVVFPRPVRTYSELLDQLPEYVMADGDGTVSINSAVSDPFPEELVIDRVVLDGITHMAMMTDPRMWAILIGLCGLDGP